jgi:glyoxylase-like metal-dependent hydrolase (beta-lactamase superfamily II)
MHLDYTLFSAGYCSHPECITIKGGRWCSQKYPALCALIKHPEYGNILFDTGYSPRFFEETKKWPLWLYKKITPVKIPNEETLIYQLQQKDINPEDIAYIVLSHFHADHIAGIRDFPNAKIICSRLGFNAVKRTKGIAALKKGFIAGLLPDDFESRLTFLEDKKAIPLDNFMRPFVEGVDIFGDGSLIAVSLPGHAVGQFGLLFTDSSQKQVFLVADSCWSSKAYRDYKLPSTITYLIHDKKSAYQNTLSKLHRLYNQNKKIRIVPSHCQEVWQELLEADNA